MATPASQVTRPSTAATETAQTQSTQDMAKEAFVLIRDRIKGHMHVNGLRSGSLNLNNDIDSVYAEFLYAKSKGQDSITFSDPETQKKFLDKVKALARFADLAEGQSSINSDLLNADITTLRYIVEQQKKQSGDSNVPLTDEYFLFNLRLEEQKNNATAISDISKAWQQQFAGRDQYVPSVTSYGTGPDELPIDGKKMSVEQLLAMGGPTRMMSRLADTAARHVAGTTGWCARGVVGNLNRLGLTPTKIGNADDIAPKLARDSDFVEITGVTKEDLNKLPEGCIVSYLDSSRPSHVGHIQVTTDPSRHGASAISDHRQIRNGRNIYGSNTINVRVFVPRGGMRDI